MQSTAVVLEQPRVMRLQEFQVEALQPDEVLLQVERVAVCGSDLPRYTGTSTRLHIPIILGHETVGRVVEMGEQAATAYKVAPDDRVIVEPYLTCGRCPYCLRGRYQLCELNRCYGVTLTCDQPPFLLGGYSEYMVLIPGSRLHKIDEAVPAGAASLASVVANGLRWVQTRGRVQIGETVVIMGCGAQALASVVAAQEAGAGLIIVMGLAKDTPRFVIARQFGAQETVNVEEESPVEAVQRLTAGELADLAIECSGAPAAITAAIDFLRPGGRMVQIGTNATTVPITTNSIVRKELEIIGGLGQTFEVEQAIKLLNSRKHPVEALTSEVFTLTEAEDAIRYALDHPQCIRVALEP
ncbi:MAG: hypothetical protein CL878_09390 [Dehalococcoidia bacterium]|nr:hypothetical protein [Dehalococcoidia bacterium]